jgi:hypothetical protein
MSKINLTSPPRERTSVAIQGLDISTPDDIVADGKCATLHNVRYNAGAWRPVHEFKVAAQTRLPQSNAEATYNIVYKHPAAPEGHYILERRFKSKYYYYDYDSAITQYQNAVTLIASFDEQQRISHFGNVLILNGGDVKYFIYKDGAYKSFVIPPHMMSSVTSSNVKSLTPKCFYLPPSTSGVNGKWVDAEELSREDQSKVTASWFAIHNTSLDIPMVHTEDGRWHGDMLLFTTWRMDDGTNISPSPLHLVKSHGPLNDRHTYKTSVEIGASPLEKFEKGVDTYLGLTKMAVGDTHDYNDLLNANLLSSCISTLRVSFPASTDTSSIKSIAIWCTRPYPVFNVSNTVHTKDTESSKNFSQSGERANTSSSSFTSFYDDTNIANEPFYLLKEFDLSEVLIDGDTSYVTLDITQPLLDNMLTSSVYTPNNNLHSVASTTTLDYNMRLHKADVTTTLCRPFDFVDELPSDDRANICYQWAEVLVDNTLYTSLGSSNRGASFLSSSPYYNVISYPDYRATYVGAEYLGGFRLREAPANNLAWYHPPHTEDEKYPPIEYAATRIAVHPNDNSVIAQPNRIQVSAANNPFSFPFENSYSVGSSNNRIIALQSAAIKIGDEKVGALPLYVFTTEGIYALRAGEETLYAAVNPVNYDKIINPNTLAINGGVVYITERGVHIISGEGSQLISTPIHKENGIPDIDFFRTCDLIYNQEYNEVMLSNNGTAYIYSLDTGYWSTRELKGNKINTEEIVHTNAIYNLTDEDETKALPMTIATRPIKLGNLEFKRLETIIPRMSSNNHTTMLSLNADGSVDGCNYLPLRSISGLEIEPHKVNPITLRRVPFSAKYFQISISMEPTSGEPHDPSITNIDFEWYHKFYHRMR